MKKVDFLNNVLKDVDMWLHYIEAKNALLIGADIAIFSALLNSGLFIKELDSLLYVSLFFLVILISICAWSFLPINSLIEIKSKSGNSMISDNLLNYAYISLLDSETYFNMISKKYFDKNNEDTESKDLCLDYCKEIVDNSRIALRKQKLFSYSLWINMMLLCVILACIIIA